MEYEPAIGLEIHTELKTKTKMFCYSLNDPNEQHPNVNICPICMGHPGTLPTINQEAVKKTIKAGLALNGNIQELSEFDRKSYFYPDLPKGYQISQYHHPLVVGGFLDLPHYRIPNRRIRIRRIHLEEDTGRLIHEKADGATLVDFNRAGVPLMELVTEPDLRSGEEVKQFGEELQKILRYIGASDADMEKGQMRVEVNISLQPTTNNQQPTTNELGTKVEIKNINSFKFAADAAEHEIKRQSAILERGEKIEQETRGWDERKQQTFSQRSKEEAHDYRYMPEPDLPPLRLSPAFIEQLAAELPELPAAKRERFVREYELEYESAEILTREKSFGEFFDAVASELKRRDRDTPDVPSKHLARSAAALATGDFLRLINDASASAQDTRITPENFAELIVLFAENRISNLAAKEVLLEMFRSGEDPSDIVEQRGLWQMSDTANLEDIVSHIIKENPKAAADYKNGKAASLQFLVGQVMKETRGKANPKVVQEILQKILTP
ncbi:MAG: Asp-tRNA(Asn)/Glu-tRNA(Gln) amidotransferase subunit GatB [Candidatus Sungbacteria bacterium]|nr:Asp-tRNA(Asn)/Glu-tRNA(Gln) amidotransferase subunit GatB [Candidatus Sungbacteria bacterium]